MFCKAPFVSQAQWADGRVSMCCNDSVATHGTMEEEWNNDSRKEARIAFSNGEIPERCKRCVKIHKGAGLVHHYDHTVAREKEELIALVKPDGSMEATPSYLHMSPSSKCQLACRMCSANVSSTYAKTFNEPVLAQVKPEDVVGYVAACAPNLEYYVFHGGEPLMSPYFNEIMQELIKFKDQIHYCVLGNGMSLKSKGVDAIQWFKEFKSSEFMFSIDGTAKVNEYQRVFANTETITKNIHRIHNEVPNMGIKFNHTLSNLTVQDLPDFYNWAALEFPWIENLNHGVVHYPYEYQVHNLKDYMREELLEKLNDMDSASLPHEYKVALEEVTARLKWMFEETPFDMKLWNQFYIKDQAKSRVLSNVSPLIEIVKIK
jgi:organic radical activating enzyme